MKSKKEMIIEWLKEQRVDEKNIVRILTAFPEILGLSIEENLKPKVEWLKEQGVDEKNIGKILTIFPQILGCSTNRIEEQLKTFEYFGINRIFILTNCTKYLINSSQTIYAKMKFIQEKNICNENSSIEDKIKILNLSWIKFKKQFRLSKEELFKRYPLPKEEPKIEKEEEYK